MSILLAERQFRTEVFPQELEIIGRRRANAGLPVPPVAGTGPSTEHDLTGLALSGGGIRSAAFSLGILQAMSAGGLLPRVDYLSTVSGGGLIGASLSALLCKGHVDAAGSLPARLRGRHVRAARSAPPAQPYAVARARRRARRHQ